MLNYTRGMYKSNFVNNVKNILICLSNFSSTINNYIKKNSDRISLGSLRKVIYHRQYLKAHSFLILTINFK